MLENTSGKLFISLKKDMETRLDRELTSLEQQFLKDLSSKNVESTR